MTKLGILKLILEKKTTSCTILKSFISAMTKTKQEQPIEKLQSDYKVKL